MGIVKTTILALIVMFITIVVLVDVMVEEDKESINFAVSSTGLWIMGVGMVYLIMYVVERLVGWLV